MPRLKRGTVDTPLDRDGIPTTGRAFDPDTDGFPFLERLGCDVQVHSCEAILREKVSSQELIRIDPRTQHDT